MWCIFGQQFELKTGLDKCDRLSHSSKLVLSVDLFVSYLVRSVLFVSISRTRAVYVTTYISILRPGAWLTSSFFRIDIVAGTAAPEQVQLSQEASGLRNSRGTCLVLNASFA